jgi:acetate kinase
MENHEQAIKLVFDALTNEEIGVIDKISEIDAIGHRIVHGGELYTKSIIIDEKVLEQLKALKELAPLHAIPNCLGVEGCFRVAPNIKNVGVFDTAFHSTIPNYAYLYAIPMKYYRDYKIRRYGFHGTSHKYVAEILAERIEKPFEDSKLIVCHLGNGSSISAVKNGKSIDTSMGFTPLEGLIMGTRAGDIDASIVPFLSKKFNLDNQAVVDLLNKQSGLLGLTEKSSDMRDLISSIESGDTQGQLALKMMAYRIKKYIGSYISALNGVDGIAFTAGIGENTPELRELVLSEMDCFGVVFDPKANVSIPRGQEGKITADNSAIPVYVIPTNEELAIARETIELTAKK